MGGYYTLYIDHDEWVCFQNFSDECEPVNIVVLVITIIANIRNKLMHDIINYKDDIKKYEEFVHNLGKMFDCEKDKQIEQDLLKLMNNYRNKIKNYKKQILEKEAHLTRLNTRTSAKLINNYGDHAYDYLECLSKTTLSQVNWTSVFQDGYFSSYFYSGEDIITNYVMPSNKENYEDIYIDAIDEVFYMDDNNRHLSKMVEIEKCFLNNYKEKQLKFITTHNKMIWECSDEEIVEDMKKFLPYEKRIDLVNQRLEYLLK